MQLDLLVPDSVREYASVTFPPPRPFQERAHKELQDGRRRGHRCQMLMAPTGAGKTYLGLNLIQQALSKGRRATFVCDRTALINQTSATADRYGLKAHGIIQADHYRTNSSFPFQIASAQTLASRGWHKTDLIVVDEAHAQLKAWTDHIGRTEATVIGLSATPFSKGLGKMFTNLVLAATMAELTESGVLVPMKVYHCRPINMEGAATSGGEWTDKAAEERGMQIAGDVVSEWSRYGENRKTICFGSTIAHCEELCQQFVQAGIMAALYTGKTRDKEREDLVEEFSKPDSTLRVLISVEALAKGFDVSDVSCVIDCRPMRKSLSTVIQMWGRGLRSHEGKVDCIILDHSGNSKRFAEDFEAIYHQGLDSLDNGEKMDAKVRNEPPPEAKEAKGCPKCGYKPYFRRCMGCGHEPGADSTVAHVAGEMEVVQLGKGRTIDREALYQQCVAYARDYSAPEKQKGRAAWLYKDMAGEWPPDGWTPERVPDSVQVSKEIRNKIVYLNIKKAKQRRAA